MNPKSTIWAAVLMACFILLFTGNSFASPERDEILIEVEDVKLNFPEIIVKGIDYSIEIELNRKDLAEHYASRPLQIIWNQQVKEVLLKNGKASLSHRFLNKEEITVSIGNYKFNKKVNPIPLWCSILPPLIAILMALFFKEVFSALFVGLFAGTFLIYSYQDISLLSAFFKAIFAISDTYVIQSLADTGHISIIVFW